MWSGRWLQAVAHYASAMNTVESSSAEILPGISRSGTLDLYKSLALFSSFGFHQRYFP